MKNKSNYKRRSNAQTFQTVADKLIERINSGKLNWRRGWNPAFGMPCNYVTMRNKGKHYRGWNLMVTMFSGYESSYWVTFDQMVKLGGRFKQLPGGEKQTGTPIILWKLETYVNNEEDKVTGDIVEKRRTVPYLQYFTIFNADQIEGIEFEKPVGLKEYGTIENIETVLNKMPDKPRIKFGGGRAYYSPVFDYVSMPEKGTFHSLEQYYSTLFHEFVHFTGHTSRLNRATVMGGGFDRHDSYSFEELIAEFGAAFLNAMFGVDTKDVEENSAAYLQSWASKLRKDPKLLYKAAAAAQKAVDYILGKVKNEEVSQEELSLKAA